MGNANVYVKPQSMNVGLTFLLVMVTKQMHRTVLRKYKCLSQTDSVTFFLLSLFFFFFAGEVYISLVSLSRKLPSC